MIAFLSGCGLSPTSEMPIAISTHTLQTSGMATPTTIPTLTATLNSPPTPTATTTPVPVANVEGLLFFDYNGSGLQDEAVYFDRMSNQLVSIEEPGLAGFSVCVTKQGQTYCSETDTNGYYLIAGVPAEAGSEVRLAIGDPNSSDAALAMRYINRWNRPVVIPEYEMNGVQVPEQHLNDTTVIPIENGVTVVVGHYNRTGLMQGYLTLPFLSSQVQEIVIWNGFDILNYHNESIGYFERQNGVAMLYDGRTNQGDPFQKIEGVNDGHNGLDFAVDIGNFVVYPGQPSSAVKFWQSPTEDDEVILVFRHARQSNMAELYTFAHLTTILAPGITEYSGWTQGNLIPDLPIYRCQIIALTGDSGRDNYFGGYPRRVPQLHFDMGYLDENVQWSYLDPFRTVVKLDPIPREFWASDVSAWTVDNLPVFCK